MSPANSVKELKVRNVSVKKKYVPERRLTVRNKAPTERERRKLEEEERVRVRDGRVERRYRRRKE